MDLIFLPWKTTSPGYVYDGGGYEAVPILEEFTPYAAAFCNWELFDHYEKALFDLEIGISSVCALEGISFLDRMHDAEEVTTIGLSRGYEPWRVEIHREVYHYPSNVWLPWLHFHFFGPFDWGADIARLSKLANTVIPYLCDHALLLSEYTGLLKERQKGVAPQLTVVSAPSRNQALESM